MAVRILATVFGVVVVAVAAMAAPARVWAADNFSREVRFGPAATIVEWGPEEFPEGLGNEVEDCKTASVSWNATAGSTGETAGAAQFNNGDPALCVKPSVFAPVPGQTYKIGWSAYGTGAGGHNFRVGFCSTVAPANCDFVLMGPQKTTGASWVFYSSVLTAPANAARVVFEYNGEITSYADHLYIQGVGVSAEDCTGAGGLAWGASGLTSPTHVLWGKMYTAYYEGCAVLSTGQWEYVPPEGFTEGDRWSVGVVIASRPAYETCNVTMQFDIPGSDAYVLLDHSITGTNPGRATGPGHKIARGEVPADVSKLVIIAGPHCVWQNIYVANVEGDPVLDQDLSPDNPGSWPGLTEGDDSPFAGCDAPDNPIDVPGWLAFGACLVATGFGHVLSAIASIPGDLVAAWDDVATLIGDAVSGALTGIWDGFTDLMGTLFVPVELGDAWDDFRALLDTKVPFVWVGEAVSFLSGMLTAGNLAGAGFVASFGVMGATVNIDFASVFGPLADYRFILAGVVYIGMGYAVFRTVGRALGMGQPE